MLLRSKALFLASILIVLGLATGCSTVARYKFRRAQMLESKGQNEQALAVYSGLVGRVPQRDARLRSQVYLRIGECLWRLDRSNEALAAFQKASEADNTNMAAHLRLGELYLAGGAAERAGEQAHTVLQLATTNLDGLALLGAASSAAGDNSMAQEAFKRVLESDPRRVTVAVALADIYNRDDQVQEARAVLRKVAAAQPSSSLPWLAMGRLEEQEGNVDAAEDSYRHAVAAEDTLETNLRLAQFLERTARVEEAETTLSHADALRPGLPIALSDFKLIAGQPTTAIDRYTTALRSPALEARVAARRLPFSQEPRAYPVEVAENRASMSARVVEADLQLAAKERTADPSLPAGTGPARLHLDEYRAELDPATVNMLEAEIDLAEDNLAAAAGHAQAAVSMAAQSAAAHYVHGVVLFRSGDRNGARSEWLEAVDRDSSYLPVRLALAEDSIAAGDLAGAEEYVVKVVREEPANIRALTLFARVLLEQGRQDSAAVIAHRAALLDSGAAEPAVLLGRIALAKDNIGAALQEFERAITRQPHDEEALEGLTQIYRRGRITRPMLQNLERVAGTAPASAPLMEIAGRIYLEHGWYADARRCLERSLAIDPSRVSAAAKLAGLKAASGDYSGALNAGARAGGNEAALLNATRAQDRSDLATAIREYDRAVREGDTSGVAANNLAWIFAEQGHGLDRALNLAQKAQSLAPDNPSVLDTLGFVHLKRREFSDAIAFLKQANRLALRQRAPEQEIDAIHRHLYAAYFRAGQNADAAALVASRGNTVRAQQ